MSSYCYLACFRAHSPAHIVSCAALPDSRPFRQAGASGASAVRDLLRALSEILILVDRDDHALASKVRPLLYGSSSGRARADASVPRPCHCLVDRRVRAEPARRSWDSYPRQRTATCELQSPSLSRGLQSQCTSELAMVQQRLMVVAAAYVHGRRCAPDPPQPVHLIVDTLHAHPTPLLAESGHQGVRPSRACSTTATASNWGGYHDDDGQSPR